MTAIIPETHIELLERPIVVALATLLDTGQPQVQPVWCSYDTTRRVVTFGPMSAD